jgi:lysyl-tRNA synthetase, class I
MHWLNNAVDELLARHPEGEIIVSSGVSPSGTYHLGTLREVATAEAIARELRRRSRRARHVHVVDDLDSLRKVPANIPDSFSQYLGQPLCDVPSPDSSDQSYADYFLKDLFVAANKMHMELEIVRAHEKYRAGFFVPAIEKSLEHVDDIKQLLAEISGHQANEQWSPIQVIEEGYLKNRPFVSINTDEKTIIYKDKDDQEQNASYSNGEVKLNWRLDWPARWWLLGVQAEPFGRDHATKGGSYDTGAVISKEIFGVEPPLPVPYDFINQTGETKKMSKSAGNAITATDLLDMLPAEVVWFFLLRYSPDKQLFFDEGPMLMRLVDEFGELLAKSDKTDSDRQLLELCLQGVDQPTVSRVPFSHLVASYQAALRDSDRTLEIIRRTEHAEVVEQDTEIIKKELQFINNWLDKRAPEDITFSLQELFVADDFSAAEQQFMAQLADKIAAAPINADGDWFHKTIYEFKDSTGLSPKELFSTLYRVLIGKTSGPRAGWFLSILPRDWLIRRLRLEA